MPPVSEKLRSEHVGRDLREQLAARLAQVRERTFELIAPLSPDALNRVHDPLLSPIAWDLGHMAAFEDHWLAQKAFGRPAMRDELGVVYDPNTAPRSGRGELPFLRIEDCRTYMDAVRDRALDCLAGADLSVGADPLLAQGFVYELILRHEMQHSETILQTLQIMTSEHYRPERPPALPATVADPGPEMVHVAAGEFELGTDRLVFSYDNERPAHTVALDAFEIERTPVTNGAYIEFIEAGGYGRPELWSEPGREWLGESRAQLPRYWRRDGDRFAIRSFADWQPVDPGKPVCHVTWFEADAFARFAGKRLPTEAEWEKAASWDAMNGSSKRRYPWGDETPHAELANLGQLEFGTTAVDARPAGASPCGALDMAGNVWEWTASGFDSYPGFRPYPYPEYSQDFFGGPYRVLRGGGWATQELAVTNTFRNWDHPQRSQIFAGFRCACNAEPGTET